MSRIKEILKEKGFADVRPSADQLELMDMTITRFNKIKDGKTDPSLEEAVKISKWMGVDIRMLHKETAKMALYDVETTSVA